MKVQICTSANNPQTNLCKTYTKSGTIPYDNGFLYNFTDVDVDGVQEFYQLLEYMENEKHSCIIRGEPSGQSKNIRRLKYDTADTKATLVDKPLEWILIDLDEEVDLPGGIEQQDIPQWMVNNILPEMFHNADYVFQFSSSAGISHWTKGHFWFMLDHELDSAQLKRWHSQNTYCDGALFNTVQIHYTAKPIFKDGIIDPVDNRTILFEGSRRKIHLDIPSEEVVKTIAYNKERVAIDSGVYSGDKKDKWLFYVSEITSGGAHKHTYSAAASYHGVYGVNADWEIFKDKCVEQMASVGHKRASYTEVSAEVDQILKTVLNDVSHNYDPSKKSTPIDDNDSITQFVKKNNKKVTKVKKKKINPIDLLDLNDVEVGVEAFGRKKRTSLMNKLFSSVREVMSLYAFEGYGKSYMSYLWVKNGHDVIFGCESNQQAQEQAIGFENLGLKVQLIVSRGYRLQTKFNVDVVTNDPTHPWDPGALNKEKTLEVMTSTFGKDESERIWEECVPDMLDLVNYDIVVTTHTRVQAIAQTDWIVKSMIKPRDVVVVYDDPSIGQFERLSDFDNKYADCIIDEKPIQTKMIGNRMYFVKPDKYVLGNGLEGACSTCFTTTEMLIEHMIKRDYPDVYAPKMMPDGKLYGGDIGILSTKLVRKKFDGFLPPIIERLRKDNKDGSNITYIADGQGCDYNLSNNKGQNCFIDDHIIIEISFPHLDRVIKLVNELGWDVKQKNAMVVAIVLDQVHQAIGRNRGYRWSDKDENVNQYNNSGTKTIVLIDPQLSKNVKKYSRYLMGDLVNVDTKLMGKRDSSCVLSNIKWLIKNYRTYILDGLGNPNTQFRRDVESVLSNKKFTQRTQVTKRMLDSLMLFVEDEKTKINRVVNVIDWLSNT